MGNYGVPPKTEYVLLEKDNIFEFIVSNMEEQPNRFYDPEKDSEGNKEQVKWTFHGRKGTESEGAMVSDWTGANIGRSPKNRLTNRLRDIEPTFDIDVCYPSFEAMKAKCVKLPVRILVGVVEKEKDGETRTYNTIEKVMPSKMGALTEDELADFVAGMLGATSVDDSGDKDF